ncbi:MAG: HAD-IIIC family phosphatase [Betaproteobacteria bacterium]
MRAEWQPRLFGIPDRAALAECVADWPVRDIRVRVHRNHGFEPVASAAAPYAAWNSLAIQWSIGMYDDSLSGELHGDADVDVVWLDTARLTGLADGEMAPWLVSRLRQMREQTANPIVVLAWPLAADARESLERAPLTAIHFPDLDAMANALGPRWLDMRAESISGTRLSNRACLLVAGELACRWLPACVLPPIKCIALDLDGTLYAGVLGEDGATAVDLTEAHRMLQECIAAMRRNGVLLALVSRNDRADVDALFAQRHDFPLRLDDFSAVEITWEEKSVALARVATQMRIGLDAIAFVDDNPGELASVASSGPVVTVHAGDDACLTAVALDHVAGMFRWHTTREDVLRDTDLRMSVARATLAAAGASADDYMRSLRPRLEYHVGAIGDVARVADLVRKTNQFNLALTRMSEVDIVRRLERHSGNVVTIALADRLSDSGIIAALVGSCDGDTLHVEEIVVSCRALGRRLEDVMLTRALQLMAEGRAPTQVVFVVQQGARNSPAREWVARYSGNDSLPASCRIAIPIARVAVRTPSTAIVETVRYGETIA